MAWLAIWDGTRSIHTTKPADIADLPQGVLTFELRLRETRGVPIIVWQGRTQTAADFRLIHYPNGSLSVEHGEFRSETPAGFLTDGNPLNVHYAWDAQGRTDTLILENTETGLRHAVPYGLQSSVVLDTLLPARLDAAVSMDHAGIADHFVPATPVSGFASGVKIQTPDGPMAVETLRAGMQVTTVKNGPQPIRWIGRTEPLARGRTAPIHMRAPYFGLTNDIWITRAHRVLLSGCDIEYLFGMDHVFARAGDLVNGRSARLCMTKPTRVYHHIMLDDHDCLIAGRCRMESALLGDILTAQGKSPHSLAPSDRNAGWPTLDRASAQSYLSISGSNGLIAA